MKKARINTEEFIRRSILLHGNKYDYSKTIYLASNKKINIICQIHGEFMQSADEHMRGRGCKSCGSQKYNTEKFIEEANKIHNAKYDYSLVNYTKSSERIIIICPIHGQFNQISNNHLIGQGCLKCSGSEKLTAESFINKAINVHGNKYDYSLVEYVNSKVKVKIVCPKHGIFEQKPDLHTNHKNGCPKCAGVGRTTNDFINDASEKHDNKYDYSKAIFEKYNKEINIICPIHGEFEQKPYIHLMGSGCQKCSESKGERKIALFLSNNLINFEKQKLFPDCKNNLTGRDLKFDFYIPVKNMCIEYDGEYHYEPWRLYFDKSEAKEKFLEVKKRDKIKTQYCRKRGINLLRIPYFELKNIDKIISAYLL